MSCSRCLADPQPANFGNPRKCAFDAAGEFVTENWNCATVDALMDDVVVDHYGNDESIQIIPRLTLNEDIFGEIGPYGWIVLTRYKHRGRTGGAVCVGMFSPAKPLTLEIAEECLNARVRMNQLASGG